MNTVFEEEQPFQEFKEKGIGYLDPVDDMKSEADVMALQH
jgi:hypothetical protein